MPKTRIERRQGTRGVGCNSGSPLLRRGPRGKITALESHSAHHRSVPPGTARSDLFVSIRVGSTDAVAGRFNQSVHRIGASLRLQE